MVKRVERGRRWVEGEREKWEESYKGFVLGKLVIEITKHIFIFIEKCFLEIYFYACFGKRILEIYSITKQTLIDSREEV